MRLRVFGSPPVNGCLALAVNGFTLKVDRCWFEGFDTAINILSFEGTVARIRQTMIVPRVMAAGPAAPVADRRGWGVGLHLAAGGGVPRVSRRLVLDHCTFEGAGFLELVPEGLHSSLEVEVKQCAVQAEELLAWNPSKPDDRFPNQFHWQGEGNRFEILGRFWIVHSSRVPTPVTSADVTDLESWSKFAVREREPIRSVLRYRTDQAARADPLKPQDFALDSPNPPGADPEQVGPWGH